MAHDNPVEQVGGPSTATGTVTDLLQPTQFG
jgi:hypothetical protein